MKINPINLLKAGILFIFLFFILAIFHLVIGFIGINYLIENMGFKDFSILLSIFTTIICLYFRVFLPLTIGTFFGIIYVFEWHWIFAILLTLPGIIFLIPKFKTKFNFKNFNNSYNNEKNHYNFNEEKESVKTNFKNSEIIDGEYKVINDENEKK